MTKYTDDELRGELKAYFLRVEGGRIHDRIDAASRSQLQRTIDYINEGGRKDMAVIKQYLTE